MKENIITKINELTKEYETLSKEVEGIITDTTVEINVLNLRKEKYINERDLFATYLFSNIEQRTYFSNQLKRHLHLSDSEYIKLIEKIEDLSIYELEQQHPNVAKAYRKIIHEADVSKRTYGRNYNEVLVNNPKVQAIFCYDQSPRELPAYMRRFAQKNNIPIIVF